MNSDISSALSTLEATVESALSHKDRDSDELLQYWPDSRGSSIKLKIYETLLMFWKDMGTTLLYEVSLANFIKDVKEAISDANDHMDEAKKDMNEKCTSI